MQLFHSRIHAQPFAQKLPHLCRRQSPLTGTLHATLGLRATPSGADRRAQRGFALRTGPGPCDTHPEVRAAALSLPRFPVGSGSALSSPKCAASKNTVLSSLSGSAQGGLGLLRFHPMSSPLGPRRAVLVGGAGQRWRMGWVAPGQRGFPLALEKSTPVLRPARKRCNVG